MTWWIKFKDTTVLIPMLALAAMTVAFTLEGIALLDAKVVIYKQEAAINAGIINHTALTGAYAKLEKACGDIVMRSKLHEH